MRRAYGAALRRFLAGGGEDALMEAYTLGRAAVCQGTRLVAFATMHADVAAEAMAKARSLEERVRMEERSSVFLAEALSPFELEMSGAKEMNETLRRANQELDRASRLKSRFIAHVSHELRTPLNSVIGFGQLLEAGSAGGLNPTQQRYAQNILSSGRHLLSLVNDLLDLSKIEAGQMVLALEPVRVDAVMEECAEELQPMTIEKQLRLEVAARAEAWAEADRKRLAQVIRNLAVNALKFTPEGGQVRLRTELRRRRVGVVVEDTGVGIPLNEQARVFEEFAQVESEARRQEQGTGLGLALTRRLVELMGGSIQLTSMPGSGTTVTVLLRRAEHAA